MLRGIYRHLDLNDLRQSLKAFYSQMGRPSVDPELRIRMLIVGYRMGIRSERRLCGEVHLNLHGGEVQHRPGRLTSNCREIPWLGAMPSTNQLGRRESTGVS
jgi:hypothetical protein